MKAKYDVTAWYMGSDYRGVFRAFSDSHRKMTEGGVCNIAGLIQTSENACFPDVSAN